MSARKADLLDVFERLRELGVALAGEACDDVGCDRHSRHRLARGRNQPAIRIGCRVARHALECGRAAALQGQMKMLAQPRLLPEREELGIQIPWLQGGK